MNISLTRKAFLDRAVSSDEVRTLAQMLADWYGQAASKNSGTLSVEVRLWGFPRAEAIALQAILTQQITARKLTETTRVKALDDDTLALEGTLLPLNGEYALPTISGSLDAVLNEPAFEDLWCEARLTLGGAQDERTMVMAGIVQNGRLWLKALWPVGRGEFPEEFFVHTKWPQEDALLTALQTYQEKPTPVPAWARTHLFPSANKRTSSGFITWYLQSSNKGFGPFLQRVGLSVAVIAVCLIGRQYTTHGLARLFNILWFWGLFWFGLGLAYLVVMTVLMVAATRRRMHDSFKRIHSQPMTHRAVDLASLAPDLLDDPSIRKFSADIEALGGRHFADIRIDPPLSGETVIRAFLFPEDATLFNLLLLRGTPGNADGGNTFRVVPAKASFFLRTAFTDGWRLASASAGSGFRKPSPNPVIFRLFPDVTHPAEMLEKHRAALRHAEQAGKECADLIPDQILSALQKDYEDDAAWARKSGFFGWGDAFRMVFNQPLPQYREEP